MQEYKLSLRFLKKKHNLVNIKSAINK